MEQTTLKYLRILIPGIIFLLGFYPIYNNYYAEMFGLKSLDIGYTTVLCLLIGSIYYQLDVQYPVRIWSHNYINKNILNKLADTYGSGLCKAQKKFLEEDKRYMHVFYNLVDNDESLKKKGNIVYFNGIFWSSSADLLILSLFFWAIYKYVFSEMQNSQTLSELFIWIAILSFVLHIISVRKHIKLSNNQLKSIDIYKKQEVVKQISDILLKMPKSNS